MHKKMSLSAALAIALCVVTTADAGQQVTLRWQFEPGESLVYRMNMSQESELPNGMGVAVVEMTTTMRWEVLEVSDEGNATVRVTTERVQMRMDGPMGNMTADSASETPPNDPVGQMVTGLAGVSYTLVFDSSGQLKEVTNLDELREQLAAAGGSNPAVGQALEQFASEDGIKDTMARGMLAFPDGPVGPGDTWDYDYDMQMPMLGTMSIEMVMTLNGTEDRDGSRIALIDSTGTMAFLPDDNPQNPAAGMMDLADAALTGTMEWDVDRGRLIRNSGDTTMQMDINAGGQQMSMVMVMHMTMELVEDASAASDRRGF
jgi:hypothetical protein